MINLKIVKTFAFVILIISTVVQAYIDISLEISVSSSDILYNIPVTINSVKEHIGISLENKQEFIVSPEIVKHKGKSLKTHNNNKDMKAQLHVSSLEGYSLQGWKRFFLEIFTFVDSRYSHDIELDLSNMKKVDKYVPLTNGLMTFGPKINQNIYYQLIKNQTNEYFKEDIVSFYTTPGGKQLKLQLGGYQQQNARGYKNGVRFYQKPIQVSNDGNKWVLPINKFVIAKERGKRWDLYTIPASNIKAVLSIQSQFVILPQKFRQDLETSFQTESIECSFTATSSQLQCSNISSIDEVLTFLSFNLDQSDVGMNISLYDLRDQYNSKLKTTSYFVKLGTVDQVQIGAPLLKGYYISLNLLKQTILFSPINRFTPEISTVSILRFIIYFIMFMFAACVGIVIWQQFSTKSERTRRFTRGKDGVRLVAYQRPNQFDDQE